MRTIIDNWVVVVALSATVAWGCTLIYRFAQKPSDEQMNKVREWLLYAVTVAEKDLGAGTGRLKLRYVYDMFVQRFKWVAEVITFDTFSDMVDEALDRMRLMLDQNKAVQNYVEASNDQ